MTRPNQMPGATLSPPDPVADAGRGKRNRPAGTVSVLTRRNWIAAMATCVIAGPAWADDSPPSVYDPLAIPANWSAKMLDLEVDDRARGRKIPLRLYLPPDAPSRLQPAPVVMFSHGLGGSCRNNPYLGQHWSARGYAAVFMQHLGSDQSVWENVRPLQRMAAMREAASAKNAILRIQDVAAVLDQLAAWNDSSPELAGRLDLDAVGMSGHSFGAVTTQAVSGQAAGIATFVQAEARIKAALMMSPSVPRGARNASQAFSNVKIPWLLMTGTEDTSPIGGADAQSRQLVFPALPPGDKYELVLHEAQHSAFSEGDFGSQNLRRNPNHHRAILATSTAFWDAMLRNDQAARTWLSGEGPRSVLEPKDRWQSK